jgi:hypothetical protein
MEQTPGIMPDYERIGRFIYAFARHADPDTLRALPVSHPMAARGAALAARFERVLAAWTADSQNGRPDSVSDAEFSAVLDEAQAFANDMGWKYGVPRIE